MCVHHGDAGGLCASPVSPERVCVRRCKARLHTEATVTAGARAEHRQIQRARWLQKQLERLPRVERRCNELRSRCPRRGENVRPCGSRWVSCGSHSIVKLVLSMYAMKLGWRAEERGRPVRKAKARLGASRIICNGPCNRPKPESQTGRRVKPRALGGACRFLEEISAREPCRGGWRGAENGSTVRQSRS